MTPRRYDGLGAMFDPVKLAEATEEIVCKDSNRTYYRFRPARFYGGISTGDCVGCNLRCAFCWSWRQVERPTKFGKLHAPEDVASRLISVATESSFRQVRISGCEPTIGRAHLLRVLEFVPGRFTFVLETNGILIGADKSYAEDLGTHSNVHVRVSIKGASEDEFSYLTGAVPDAFGLQLQALRNLLDAGVKVHPACMTSFSSPENIARLRERLSEISSSFEEFEVEELVLYPHVKARLKHLGVEYRTAHKPDAVPPEQI
jgi:uncharacterized Fe-S cluster-containing radical SAM superfamily protein